jgi:hypothetical protein
VKNYHLPSIAVITINQQISLRIIAYFAAKQFLASYRILGLELDNYRKIE